MAFGLKRSRQRAAALLAICLVVVSCFIFSGNSSARDALDRVRTISSTTAQKLKTSSTTTGTTGTTIKNKNQPLLEPGSSRYAAGSRNKAGGDNRDGKGGAATSWSLFLQRQNFTGTVVLAKEPGDDTAWIKEELVGVPVMIYNLEKPPDPWSAPQEAAPAPAAPAPAAIAKRHKPRHGVFSSSSFLSSPEPPSALAARRDSSGDIKEQTIQGNDVVAYLTYIVDHYDDLPDIVIFTRQATRQPQHRGIIGEDLPATLKRLNGLHVWTEGYVNLSCETRIADCPRWTEGQSQFATDADHRDFQVFNAAWRSLYPGQPTPQQIGQAGGNQFAVTRDAVRHAKSRVEWTQYRDWVADRSRDLTSSQSSRVWEFTWQYVFKGRGMHCPKVTSCYCDAYGVCLGGFAAAEDIANKKDGQVRLIDRFHRERAAGRDPKEWVNSIERLRKEILMVMKKGTVEDDRWIAVIGSKPEEGVEEDWSPGGSSAKGKGKKNKDSKGSWFGL